MAISVSSIPKAKGTARMLPRPPTSKEIVHEEALLAWTLYPRPPKCMWRPGMSAEEVRKLQPFTTTVQRDQITCSKCK